MVSKIGELMVVFLCISLYFIYVDPRYLEIQNILMVFASIGQYINFFFHAFVILLDLCGILVCLLH